MQWHIPIVPKSGHGRLTSWSLSEPSCGSHMLLFERFQEFCLAINHVNFFSLDDAQLVEPLHKQLRSMVGSFFYLS